jgi:hypothetical protein
MPTPHATDAAAERVIHAEPSKAFFIDMLTRDIGIIECLFDLIDNALDKAVTRSGANVMSILERDNGSRAVRVTDSKIAISYTQSEFTIVDTCGGISIDEAVNDVFRLGGEIGSHGGGMRLSVYGIGMKRAMFKLGKLVTVESWTDDEYFKVDIDVDTWKDEAGWSFHFTKAGQRTEHKHHPGTRIHIRQLNDGIRERFKQKSFETDLRHALETAYALFVKAGVAILVNERAVTAALPQLGHKTFTPARKRLTFNGVDILIVAGVSPKEDRTAHGWYVYCNGRAVVDADKTTVTGWGDNYPQFHSKYNHFLGFVYFGSKKVESLPWRTTKQGLDLESPVYQRALAEMKLQARPVLNYLSSMYPGDLEPAEPERAALDGAEPVSLENLPKRNAAFKVKKVRRAPTDSIKIQYHRPRAVIERIKKHLGEPSMSAVKVGEHTFDYYVEQEIE